MSHIKMRCWGRDDEIILLSACRIHRQVSDDDWNKKPMSDVTVNVMDCERDECIAHFNYRAAVGQVCRITILLDKKQKKKIFVLRQQILIYMMRDMQRMGATHIWEVTPEDSTRKKYQGSEPFYSVLWNFYYVEDQVNTSLVGGGYIMEIPKDLDHDLKILTKPKPRSRV